MLKLYISLQCETVLMTGLGIGTKTRRFEFKIPGLSPQRQLKIVLTSCEKYVLPPQL